MCGQVVCGRCGGRRREADGGIQNQKQEPHTKMWGTEQCFFFCFLGWGMVIQTTFQIEDNLNVLLLIEDIRGVLKNTFLIEDNIS